jgi:hypothetical protein
LGRCTWPGLENGICMDQLARTATRPPCSWARIGAPRYKLGKPLARTETCTVVASGHPDIAGIGFEVEFEVGGFALVSNSVPK